MSFISLVYPGTSFLRDLLSELSWSSRYVSPSITESNHAKQLWDFDLDPSTGFLPDKPPLERLPSDFDLWEIALASARDALSLGEDQSGEAIARRDSSRHWRSQLQNVLLFIFDA